MKVERISTSEELPVKLEQLKEHLRIMSDDFDSILILHLKAAIASAEEFTGQVLWPGNFRLTGDFDKVLKTGIMPITDIVSVRLDGEELDVTEIGISGSSLYFPEGMKGNSVIIEFIAGFKEVPFDVACVFVEHRQKIQRTSRLPCGGRRGHRLQERRLRRRIGRQF